jgi:uncharacterized protein with NRDE domain
MNYNDLTATSLAKKNHSHATKEGETAAFGNCRAARLQSNAKKIDHRGYLWQNYEQTSAQL